MKLLLIYSIPILDRTIRECYSVYIPSKTIGNELVGNDLSKYKEVYKRREK